MRGQPAAGIGSLAALHVHVVVVVVVDQCAACSAACDIKMLGLLRPETRSNRDQLCNRIRQQFRGHTASGDVAMRRQIRFGCYAGHGPGEVLRPPTPGPSS